MIFKVAILQMRSENRAYEDNIKMIIKNMTEAKINNADILLLPECFMTGYDLTIENDAAISESDLAVLCDKAKELGVGIVATALTKGNVKPQNSAFVIGKHGEILMKYSKVHTCDFADERVLESGTEFKVCDLDGVKIGIMICYDREYPESARILMLKGTEIILVPGNSCAYSPICWDDNDECVDNTLLLADAETEGLFYAAFDMDAIRKYREREMMGNTFRKVQAYSDLLSDEIQYPFKRSRK